jgi:gliding motility-associated-like protein
MKRVFFSKNNNISEFIFKKAFPSVIFLLYISATGFGQCTNPPALTLSSTSGSTCKTTPVTVTDNAFGGSATKVTIKDDGGGSVSPTSSNTSPFSFTYTPKKGDVGKTVIITITTDNPSGAPCAAAKATYTLTVFDNPTAPVIGTIVQPTCDVPTGSVALSGLPSTGTWTITSNPGGVETTGMGISTILSGLSPGTYTFTVSNSAGCISSPSKNAVINAQPLSPASPAQSVECVTGSALVTVTSPVGPGLEYSLDGGTYQTATSFTGVADGNHNITVRNSTGCTTTGNSFPVSCSCVNSSTVTLGTATGITCNISPVTVSNNTFDGTATGVSLTHNGAGTLSPLTINTSPFDFIYTPSSADAGNTITITIIASSSSPQVCEATATYTLSVNVDPIPPTIGTITHPTCLVPTGSVLLGNLPSSGTWLLTRYPGGILTTGTGPGATISGLPSGNYTFTVSDANGCISAPSENIVINAPPFAPAAPTVEDITSPTCTLPTGSVILSDLPASGSWTLTRYPDNITSTGTGTTITLTGLVSGTYNYTVTNSEGCISMPSQDVVIPAQPGNLTPPEIGTITHPSCNLSTGSVVLNGLPSSGTWTLTRAPGAISSTGTGLSTTITGLPSGSYTYTVTNADGCISAPSAGIVINAQPLTPGAPTVGTITPPTCTSPTGSVVLGNLPSSGTWTLTRYPDTLSSKGTGTTATLTGLVSGTYNYTVTNSEGCISVMSQNVIIPVQPGNISPPQVGTITHPSCNLSTGSVVLTGLPSSGTWVLTRSPGGITSTGTGLSTTITGLPSGTYAYTVTNIDGCISAPSASIVINDQPLIPVQPAIGTITTPTCILSTGSVELNNLPAFGVWTLTRYPGTVTSIGTGTSSIITGLSSGTYNFTVMNADGCISLPSPNVVVPQQPLTPSAPLIGTVNQPTYPLNSGSALLYGLPATGTWILTRLPDSVAITGSGIVKTVYDIPAGEFTFSVTNSSGCSSGESESIIILDHEIPVLKITDPAPVCSPETVDLSDPDITKGSTPGLLYTYWTDARATDPYLTPSRADSGTYYIKGTNQAGYFDITPVIVVVVQKPVANAGPDQTLEYEFETTLEADIDENETGLWSALSGSGGFTDITDPKTTVTNLTEGENILLWAVTNGVCPSSQDSVIITINDLVIPTMITPNMDGKNDYFVLRGINTLGKTHLVIFDRRGKMVYKNDNYDNSWNGVDLNNQMLPDDTYFYALKTANGKSLSGYIIIRK